VRSLISAVLCGVVVMVAVPEAAAADGRQMQQVDQIVQGHFPNRRISWRQLQE